MNRKWVTRIAAGLAALLVGHAQAAEKPNIVFVLADDLGWADVTYNGAKFFETPNIDRLAKDGMILDRFYPCGPNCAPSRACMMTGMYTPRHKLYQPGGASKGSSKFMRWKVPTRGMKDSDTFKSNKDQIDPKWICIPEVLKQKGYTCAHFGKWHLGKDTQGFDVNSSGGKIPNETTKYYGNINVAENLTNAGIKFMQNCKDKPFFLYVAHWDVHAPIRARKAVVAKYKKKLSEGKWDRHWNTTYAAMIEAVDVSVGRLRAQIKELGIEKKTFFFFASDNGGLPSVSGNAPLYAGKGSLFEGGIRTAACAAWPGVIKPGSRSAVPLNGVDLMPTFAEIAGDAPLPTEQPVDGRSFFSLLKGQGDPGPRSIFWHYPLYLQGGKGNAVLPVYGTDRNYWRAVPSSAIMQGDFKLIYYYEYGTYKLFNVKDDIGEKNDLAKSNPERAGELYTKLMAWVKATKAPVPNIPNPAFDANAKAGGKKKGRRKKK